jgi:hypothetical protein
MFKSKSYDKDRHSIWLSHRIKNIYIFSYKNLINFRIVLMHEPPKKTFVEIENPIDTELMKVSFMPASH